LTSYLEEKIKLQGNDSDTLVIENDTWLLKESKGNSLFDKFILNSIKLTYRCIRLLYRIALGKTRSDKLWNDRKITFRGFLYKIIELLRLDNSLLLVFDVPNYNFKFYSRVTRKINNFAIQDMYVSMSSHEEEILEHFTPKEGDVIIDIGAAFGFYTILASKMIGPKGKVIAIEPQPESFQMLNSNIKLNKLNNVKTLNYAVYSNETKLQLYSSYSVLPERAGNNTSDYIEINCNKLDNLISQIEKIDKVNWIKIDVEGTELEVLKGAHNILSKNKDIALLIEIHNISEGKNLFQSIMDLLDSYNFKIEFEKVYANGERHIIVRKQQL
jgi:FkbM family methyltransferase